MSPVLPVDVRLLHLTSLTVVLPEDTLILTSPRHSASETVTLPVDTARSSASAEIVLYSPDERFRYPVERRAYIEGCAEVLSTKGLRLSVKTLSQIVKGGQA